MIYWLDRNGAEVVSSLNGTPLQEFTWRKEPRWFQVEHDLAVNDFRLDIEAACRATPDVTLETWIPESEFWSHPDQITYKASDYQVKRKIRPDGFFMLTTGGHRLRYLLEIDRSTEDNPRFLREKVLPGLAYLMSEAYAERFGHRSGRWLIVTTGERRLNNMLQQARRGDTKGLFYFTTYNKLNVGTILSAPIWRRLTGRISFHCSSWTDHPYNSLCQDITDGMAYRSNGGIMPLHKDNHISLNVAKQRRGATRPGTINGICRVGTLTPQKTRTGGWHEETTNDLGDCV